MLRNRWLDWGVALGGVVLLGSALAVIYGKYHSRSIFIEIEKQERALDQYEIEWSQMQLEQTMLAEQNRVEQVGREQLKLVNPERDKIIYIKPE